MKKLLAMAAFCVATALSQQAFASGYCGAATFNCCPTVACQPSSCYTTCKIERQKCKKTVYDTVWVSSEDSIIRHYNSDVSNILNNYCITCHGGSAPSAGLLLNNYASAKSTAQSGLLTKRINDTINPMPPAGLLPQDKRDIIQKWIDDGLLE